MLQLARRPKSSCDCARGWSWKTACLSIQTVAGADVALDLEGRRAIAGVIVYHFPEMIELERVAAERRLTFPYVPGLLSFREIPVLLKVFARVRHTPDVIFYDGHGYAHPRRFGITCHLGVLRH
jgi:deoxyribonuclease V